MLLNDTYQRNGWIGPIEIVDKESAEKYKALALEAEKNLNLMHSDYRCKSNVLFPWVDEISRSPKLVKVLEELIGPNFHCVDTLFWIKQPGDGKNVSFHQDATYWNFDNKHKAVTVWFAFDDVTEEHGSIEYVQGSHKVFQRRHKDIKSETNLLMRGQTVDEDVPKERVKTRVPAGHVLIHSPYIVHGSDSNKASTPRVAMGMIFASTECKPKLGLATESTVMVHGVDEFNYMKHDPRPTGVWEVDLKVWQDAYDRQHVNYYQLEQDAI